MTAVNKARKHFVHVHFSTTSIGILPILPIDYQNIHHPTFLIVPHSPLVEPNVTVLLLRFRVSTSAASMDILRFRVLTSAASMDIPRFRVLYLRTPEIQ